MATVHFGRISGAAGFSRVVAIKRMNAVALPISELAASLADEARLTSRIRHTNVVPTLDVVNDGDELLLVMDYVEGETLSRLVRVAGPVPWRIACSIATGVLRGLHAAHEATSERGRPLHIIHRDVSPQNILVGIDGVARVADFGIAKATVRMQSTAHGTVKGKLAYLSPEQARGEKDQDRRVDVWATSVVLWEALTGERLFATGGMQEIAMNVLTGPIAAPSSKVGDIPAVLDEVVMKGLAREKAVRWTTAAEMADALERIGEVAPLGEVAEWVRTHAREALETRKQHLEDIDALSGVSVVTSAGRVRAASRAAEHETTASVQATPTAAASVPARPARTKRLAGIAVVAVLALTVGAWALMRSPEPAVREDRDSGAVAADTPPSLELPSAPSTGVAIGPDPNASASAAASSSAPASANKRRPPVRVGKGASSCDPPFTVDSAGIKIPRRECLH